MPRGVPFLFQRSMMVLASLLLLGGASEDAEILPSSTGGSSNFTNSVADRLMLRDGNSIPVVGLGVAFDALEDPRRRDVGLGGGVPIDRHRRRRIVRQRTSGGAGRSGLPGVKGAAGEEKIDHGGGSRWQRRSPPSRRRLHHDEAAERWTRLAESYEALNAPAWGGRVPARPVDLYLVHSPFGGRLVETWDALLYLQKHGYVQSIGVSNFGTFPT